MASPKTAVERFAFHIEWNTSSVLALPAEYIAAVPSATSASIATNISQLNLFSFSSITYSRSPFPVPQISP